MLEKLKGYKTVTSAAIIGIIAMLKWAGYIDESMGTMIIRLAEALGIYGIYDRVRDKR